jgi:hypothetical protein
MRQLPVVYGGHDAGPRPETRQQVCAALERGVDPVVVTQHVARGVSDLWGTCLTEVDNLENEPACFRGCSHCCHQRVDVTALEVFLIVRYLRTATDYQPSQIFAAAERHASLSSRQHFLEQCACPFLEGDGACAVYEVRPLACRRVHSLDVEVCRRLAADPTLRVTIPTSEPLDWNLSALTWGYYEGLAHAGVPPHQYELAQAVALALRTEDAEMSWRRGEDILACAMTRCAEALDVAATQLRGTSNA